MRRFNLPDEIIAALEGINITTPTEIQEKTIPIALDGKDVLASSQTGSGKTFAFLLPIIHSILKIEEQQKTGEKNFKTEPLALILVPTRELATQVRDTLMKLTKKVRLTSALLIGGEPMHKQRLQLSHNTKIIIGTPGRIIDHLERKNLSLSKVKTLVLDEMDRMLNMGMKEQLEEISKDLPKEKQVLMFSATMPPYIIDLSRKYMANPERISVGSTTQVSDKISQETLHIEEHLKFSELIKQISARQGSIIIFVKTKRGADKLARMLTSEDHKSESLHGDLSQNRRDRVILSFRRSNYRILVATDVAARGLDIPHTEHVINYDLPMCAEDYLHRIGRTGRAGATGNALSFVSNEDRIRWKAIDRLINKGEGSTGENPYEKKPGSGGNKRRSFGNKSNRSFDRTSKNDGDNKHSSFNDRKRSPRKTFGNAPTVVYRSKKSA
jgi:superfamily II DNA/RNA helicase